jgi:SOS-response transcriptional repressor LexA
MKPRYGKHHDAGHDGPGGGGEWERDALVWLVGQHGPPLLPNDIGDPVLARAHECYWEWLGREEADRASVAERARTTEAASRLTARVREAVDSRQVWRLDHAPTEIRARVHGPVRSVLDRARRTGAAPLVELAVAAGAGRTLWDEPSDSWVVVPTEAQLPDRRYVALRIVGDSMTPLLHSGDTVLVDLDGDVRPGAILVARGADDGGASDGYIVKRVDAVSGATLQLSSLNPAYPGLAIPSDRGHILGPVVLRWCTHAAAVREC